MDIFAHGLWAGAGAALLKEKTKKSFSIRGTAFFGIFPDLFAFTVLPLWILVNLLDGDITVFDLPHDLPPLTGLEPSPPDTFWIFGLTSLLYALSHSIIVFLLIFGILAWIRRRILWEAMGWLFHIVLDVFTHSYSSYPTPVFWPISVWKFDGLSWHTPWFMAVNYVSLIIVYLLIIRRQIRKNPRFLANLRENWNLKLALKKMRRLE